MLQQTRAIVLRTVAYGDTSLIVSALTHQFGVQQYIVKGARRQSKKGNTQAVYLQPASILDLVVYRNELKQLHFIREMQWSKVYQQVFTSITRHAVALFIIELITKCLKQPEVSTELYEFVEHNLLVLDEAENAIAANLPLHFSIQLATHLGFRPDDNFSAKTPYLDLQDGRFLPEPPIHGMYLDPMASETTFKLMQHDNAITLYRLKLNQAHRRELLEGLMHFYQYHISDFGTMKTLPVLQEVLA